MSPDHAAAPLKGVNVIDFGQYIAGPAVSMILGDLGARVIHIDPPEGPRWQHPANATLNRNKHCIRLNLKDADDNDRAHQLINHADIVIENFRPGVMKRLGLDLRALREERPSLITASLPGFASTDELRRDWRAFESIIAAASGIFTDMGLNRILMGINPTFTALPISSAYGAIMATASVALALQARNKTGCGDHIEVPISSAVMEGLSYNSIYIEDYPERYKTQREKEIERRRSNDEPMDVSYDDLQDLLDPFFRSYECKDGRMFYVVCPSHKEHARRCLEKMGLYDGLVAEGLREEPDTYQSTEYWASEASLGVYPLPRNWATKIAERMKEKFLTKTAWEWEKLFGEGRFPGAAHRSMEEWVHDKHAHAAGLMTRVEDPVLGSMIQPGPMVWIEKEEYDHPAPSPRREASFEDALTLLQEEPPVPLLAISSGTEGGWLDGVRILDLCNVIAGPHSASFLARFGAEVIKLDPATPFYDCWNTIGYGLTHMRGKKSILGDIRTPRGRALLKKLIKSVDVIIWNTPDRQARQYNLGIDDLREINPDVIFCRLDCFGGPMRGPRSDYLGYDDLVQATTGVMTRFGGGPRTPEEHAHVGTIDVMCGFAAALGVAALLHHKYQGGEDRQIATSLSALSGLLQIPYAHDYEGRGPFDEPAGRFVRGFDPLRRLYGAKDGQTIFLNAYENDLPALNDIADFTGVSSVPSENLEAFLVEKFKQKPAQEWVDLFIERDVALCICDNIENQREANQRPVDETPGITGGSFSYTTYEHHPSGYIVTQFDPCAIRPTDSTIYAVAAPEKYGDSTLEILRAFGYSNHDIQTMISSGDVSISWSENYLPN